MTLFQHHRKKISLVLVIGILSVIYLVQPEERKSSIRFATHKYTIFMKDYIADNGLTRWIGFNVGLYKSESIGAYIGDNTEPTKAAFKDPTGIYVDNEGKIFISVRRHHRIRVIDKNVIHTAAGNGRRGYSLDDVNATNSRLARPEGLDGDNQGNIYVADSFNHSIRMIKKNGKISTIAGNGLPGYAGDNGPALHSQLNAPMDVKLGPSGAIYILERDNHCVRKITPDGIIRTIAGNGKAGFSGDGGPAVNAQLNTPYGIAVDKDENVYIADSANNRVRKISSDGHINTIAGTGAAGYSGDGSKAINAVFNSPQAIAITPDQQVVINDEHNHAIRKINSNGIVTTIAGTGKNGFSGDGGPATKAQLNDPEYIWIDKAGSLYITDGDNQRVRKVAANGIITTIAGNGSTAIE